MQNNTVQSVFGQLDITVFNSVFVRASVRPDSACPAVT